MRFINNYRIDVQFLQRLSFQLDRFSKKSDGLWNCRCPICGDSKKDKSKRRGFFGKVDSRINYFCQNCNANMPISQVLKLLDDNLYREYLF